MAGPVDAIQTSDQLLALATQVATRPCGECQECCMVYEIPDVTPGREKCQHQCAAGCAIYATRPKSCADFYCFWKLGLGDDAERPDRCGVVCDSKMLTDSLMVVRVFWTRTPDRATAARFVVLLQPHVNQITERGYDVAVAIYPVPPAEAQIMCGEMRPENKAALMAWISPDG